MWTSGEEAERRAQLVAEPCGIYRVHLRELLDQIEENLFSGLSFGERWRPDSARMDSRLAPNRRVTHWELNSVLWKTAFLRDLSTSYTLSIPGRFGGIFKMAVLVCQIGRASCR